MHQSISIILRVLALLAAFTCPIGHAQGDYPSRPLRLIVGFPAGTSPDVVARLLAQKLGEEMRQPVVVENFPGAGGLIGAQTASKAAPDGYTIFMNTVSDMSIAPHIYSKLPFNPASFEPISLVMYSDVALVVPSQNPARNLKEYVEWARKQQPLFMASLGPGTPAHFGVTTFAKAFSLQAEPVHYKVASDALTNVATGQVSGIFGSLALVAPFVQDGRMRALAVSAPTRLPALPNVPTFGELGYAKFLPDAWVGIAAPSNTPAPVLDRLSSATQRAMRSPEVVQRLESLGLRSAATTRGEFAAFLHQDLDQWGKVIKASGFKLE